MNICVGCVYKCGICVEVKVVVVIFIGGLWKMKIILVFFFVFLLFKLRNLVVNILNIII